MTNSLISIIIPTKNSGYFLENTLKSIKEQSYKKIETILVDGDSKDNTLSLAQKYNATIYKYNPKVPKGFFDAPHRRNYGVKKAKGKYVYYLDADMELPKDLIKEAVVLCEEKFDALILPEDSFGEGVWARAKNLERRCYWGDDTIEAPRFFKKSVWEKVGGLDESLGGGGDDWDLHQKLIEQGYKVGRTKSIVMHNEGKLQLKKLFKKRFMYGKDSVLYLHKRPIEGAKSYTPFRQAYFRNWQLFMKRPSDSFFFIIMRTTEYIAGASGIIYSAIKK
ncbi:MAG: glycosyltransferase family 2 protein [Candidatus Levyibacteriota bacterium]